jgi:hypothetical protein
MRKYRPIVRPLLIGYALLYSGIALAGGLPKPHSNNPEAQKFIDQAWRLYKENPSDGQSYQKGIELLEWANKLDSGNHTILAELSRFYWNHGDNLPKATRRQQAELVGIYEKGLKYAEKSLAVRESAGGHYWAAVNKAASMEFSNIFSQAAALPAIASHAAQVKKLDEDYYYGAYGRLWSEILCRVPKVVVQMVGWDVQMAVDAINESIRREPDYLSNYVQKARLYHAYFGQDREALNVLDIALKKDPAAIPDEVNANRAAQEEARVLWKSITGREYR